MVITLTVVDLVVAIVVAFCMLIVDILDPSPDPVTAGEFLLFAFVTCSGVLVATNTIYYLFNYLVA